MGLPISLHDFVVIIMYVFHVFIRIYMYYKPAKGVLV